MTTYTYSVGEHVNEYDFFISSGDGNKAYIGTYTGSNPQHPESPVKNGRVSELWHGKYGSLDTKSLTFFQRYLKKSSGIEQEDLPIENNLSSDPRRHTATRLLLEDSSSEQVLTRHGSSEPEKRLVSTKTHSSQNKQIFALVIAIQMLALTYISK